MKDTKEILKASLGKLGSSAKTARCNADEKSLDLIIIDAPGVDPRDLKIGDKIYGIKTTPIFDDENPDIQLTRKAIGVIEETVGIIDGLAVKDHIVINGKIDLPTRSGSTVPIKDLWLANQEDAREVARGLVSAEFELADAAARKANFERDWLKRMLDEDRF